MYFFTGHGNKTVDRVVNDGILEGARSSHGIRVDSLTCKKILHAKIFDFVG
jgi:hypothetical protein